MLRKANKPIVEQDISDEIDSILDAGKPVSTRRELWPFSFIVVRFNTGSTQYMIEFRVVMKFVITVGIFWKA